MKSKRKTIIRRRNTNQRNKQNHIMGPMKQAHRVDLSNVRRSKRIANRKYPHESESVIFVGTVQPISSTFSLTPSETSATEMGQYVSEMGEYEPEMDQQQPEIYEEQQLQDSFILYSPEENDQEQLMQLEIVFEMRSNESSNTNMSNFEAAVAGAGDNIPNTVAAVERPENNESEGTLFQDITAYILSVFGDDNSNTPNAER